MPRLKGPTPQGEPSGCFWQLKRDSIAQQKEIHVLCIAERREASSWSTAHRRKLAGSRPFRPRVPGERWSLLSAKGRGQLSASCKSWIIYQIWVQSRNPAFSNVKVSILRKFPREIDRLRNRFFRPNASVQRLKRKTIGGYQAKRVADSFPK